MTYIFQWEVFTLFATISTLSPALLKNKELNAVIYPISIVLWIASTYIWAIDSVNTPLFALTWIHLVPIMLNIVWGVTDYNRIADKRSKYN